MKLVNFVQGGRLQLGIKTGEGILYVERALDILEDGKVNVPLSMQEVIDGGAGALQALQGLVDKMLASGAKGGALFDEADQTFGPSVLQPGKIICVGLNYRKHAEETNAKIPEYPILFNKFSNALTGHGHDVSLAERVTSQVDYEAELAIVIGKEAKDVPREEALNYVLGYSCANDLSARDLQLRTAQWMLGKTLDGFAPLGPYLVTADEVGNPNELAISCKVNGETRQSSNTSDMIFHCDEIVSYISRHMTLQPGDVILTGTPEGVVLGLPEAQRVYLKDGDVVTIEIEKLGALTNRMVSERK
ncbi:fumarylacetoacetate hydrolase family protein [Paenibacillus caseinilyticus]|uniref:5-carboxymethyl-2-hydroxymuconate isomerase n=1 Tax=Paenibacillus mucilaginosus K02 TaxID=997761 RepID=I0BDR6_9BACL|nr:fumarylacetoacetate hydrolase family protein [Paenibacillus mucilaginosus]AFH60513.1 5-carboxymethyl-2-hydroxymuconate isomerase [Paenibacillus mucilaginosus K02]